MKIVNLDHMVLTVNDLEKSKNFYHEIVGLPVITEQTDASHASLVCGNSLLRLRQVDNRVQAIVAGNLTPGSFDFCLEAADAIDDVIKSLQKNGVAIEQGPVEKHGVKGKMLSVYFRDPDGNLVEISSYKEGVPGECK